MDDGSRKSIPMCHVGHVVATKQIPIHLCIYAYIYKGTCLASCAIFVSDLNFASELFTVKLPFANVMIIYDIMFCLSNFWTGS